MAGNTTTGNPGDDCDGCTSSGPNLISTSSSSPSPMLGPLQYNGGPTETMMPLTGSPALNAGFGSTLSTDQRGFPRPTGNATSDLGAVQTGPLTVTTTADTTNSGTTCGGGDTCSLRDALTLANSQGSGDIVFASGLTGTITLTSALPAITGTVNITGPGANLLTISGGGAYQVFNINSGVTVNLSGLTIANGIANSVASGFYGGGIYNNGTLTVSNSALSGNTASSSGGGIENKGTLTVSNSTFSSNSANDGGGIDNSGPLTMSNSTFSGNTANGGGGGIYDGSGTVTITNSIVAGNKDTGSPGDDCDGCTLSGKNLVSTPGNIQNPLLGPLAYNGTNQTVQTLLPLPGSLSIEAGLASTLTTDQRGMTRPTGSGVVSDLGAVQTNYTAVQFVQQPTYTLINTTMTPAVTLSVFESGAAAVNIPVPLTFSGNGALAGTLTETTAPGANGTAAIASYSNLSVNEAGTDDTLNVSLPITAAGITPALTLTASSSFDITVLATTITWTQTPPTSVVYGAAPIKLAATASSGATVSYQVISGPATIIGSTLSFTGAGTVVIEAYTTASGNYGSGSLTANIVVTQASQTITWTQTLPTSVVYGAAPIKLAATASSGATVSYQVISGPATIIGSTLSFTGAGTVVVAANQAGNTNYSAAAQVTQTFVVNKATPTIAWPKPANITYGTPLSATQLNATVTGTGGAALSGTSVYSPGPGTYLTPGAQPLHVTFTPTDTVDYSALNGSVTLTVNKASTALTAQMQSLSLNDGQSGTISVVVTGQYSGTSIAAPSGTVSYSIVNSASATVASGTATLSSGAASIPMPSTLAPGSYTVDVTYGGDGNYAAATSPAVVNLVVSQIQPTISWTQPAAITYGASLGGALNAMAMNGTAVVPGTMTYTATATGGNASPVTSATIPPAGIYTLGVAFTPTNTTAYKSAIGTVTLVVNKAAAGISLTTSATTVLDKNPITFTATVSSPSGLPTGTVTFFDGATTVTPIGTGVLTGSVATLTTSNLSVGTHTITAVYSGDSNFITASSPALLQMVQDFNLSISTSSGSSTTATVVPGGTANYTLIISPTVSSTFPANVALSVGGLPTGATYTLTLPSIAAGSGTTDVTLAIKVPNNTIAMLRRDSTPHSSLFGTGFTPIALGMLLLPFTRRMRNYAKRLGVVTTLLLFLLVGAAAAAGLTGCGVNTGYFGQAQHSYTVSVTGTSGVLVHSTTVTLNVQ